MMEIDKKVGQKMFARTVGVAEGTLNDNIKRLIACDEIVILSMEYEG